MVTPVPNIGLQRTARLRLAAAEAGPFGRRMVVLLLIGVSSTALASRHVDLRINGVTLGSVEAQVRQAFGKPIRTETGRDTELGMGDLLTLFYPGLTVELCKPEGSPPAIPAAKEFRVSTLHVSDRRWTMSPGIRIGMRRAELDAILGHPDSAESESGSDVLDYSPFKGDNIMAVKLRRGVVVDIEIAEDWS